MGASPASDSACGLFIAVQNSKQANVSRRRVLWSRTLSAQPRETQSSFRRRQRASGQGPPALPQRLRNQWRSCSILSRLAAHAVTGIDVLPRRLLSALPQRKSAVGVVMSKRRRALANSGDAWVPSWAALGGILEAILEVVRRHLLAWRLA
jgi:hypothetical protein